jgi:Fic family protein
MSETKFMHYDLKLAEPSFGSGLTDLIIELDHLRKKQFIGSTHHIIFSQLKRIFHMLESIGSARIEGNNTTVAEFIETKLENSQDVSSEILEILNLERAMAYLEDKVDDYFFDHKFLIDLHDLIIAGLPSEEGVTFAGSYRKFNVSITRSAHMPPDYHLVEGYMQDLLDFINNPDSSKYDLIKMAIAHHRFAWIHPFSDGNGRTVRMLTHAMLIRFGFGGSNGRIINPTAIFCIDRIAYYNHLAAADQGSDESILHWCEYVLKGLKVEIEKIDRLLDYVYLKKEILLPTLAWSLERKYITDVEAKILKRAIDKSVIQASDIKEFFPGQDNAIISRQIKKLIDKKMLIPEKEGARKYIIRFDNNFLLRGIIKSLGEKGFLPIKE